MDVEERHAPPLDRPRDCGLGLRDHMKLTIFTCIVEALSREGVQLLNNVFKNNNDLKLVRKVDIYR